MYRSKKQQSVGGIKIGSSALALLFFLLSFTLSCTRKQEPRGSVENPIRLFFVPSVDSKVLESNSKVFKTYLEANTPYKFEISIPQSYIAVVEAFGTKRADVATMNTFGYALAHKKYEAEARLTVIRHGLPTYQSQIIARADSGIDSIEDLNGKKIAFVDPASTSGYLIPLSQFKKKNVKPGNTMFAMKHDSVVSMVYQKQVDAGATFHTPAHEGKIEDARRLVLTQYPDVIEKVKIIELSDPVPNDPVVFRKGLDEEIKKNIIGALKSFIKTPEGLAAFKKVSTVTGLKDSSDKDYEATLKMYDDLKVQLGERIQ